MHPCLHSGNYLGFKPWIPFEPENVSRGWVGRREEIGAELPPTANRFCERFSDSITQVIALGVASDE